MQRAFDSAILSRGVNKFPILRIFSGAFCRTRPTSSQRGARTRYNRGCTAAANISPVGRRGGEFRRCSRAGSEEILPMSRIPVNIPARCSCAGYAEQKRADRERAPRVETRGRSAAVSSLGPNRGLSRDPGLGPLAHSAAITRGT